MLPTVPTTQGLGWGQLPACRAPCPHSGDLRTGAQAPGPGAPPPGEAALETVMKAAGSLGRGAPPQAWLGGTPGTCFSAPQADFCPAGLTTSWGVGFFLPRVLKMLPSPTLSSAGASSPAVTVSVSLAGTWPGHTPGLHLCLTTATATLPSLPCETIGWWPAEPDTVADGRWLDGVGEALAVSWDGGGAGRC